MYPITRESVMAAISSSVAEKAVCWCDGRKKRRRRIFCRLTHLAVGGRVIGGLESGKAILAAATRAWNILSWRKRLVNQIWSATDDHLCYILEAVKYPRQDRLSDGHELLRHSGVE